MTHAYSHQIALLFSRCNLPSIIGSITNRVGREVQSTTLEEHL